MKVKIISLIFLFFISCERDELPVKSYDRGDVQIISVPLESNYTNQVYVKLSNNSIVKINNKFAWDLGFSCKKSTLFLNSSKAMYVSEVKNTLFEELLDTNGFEKYKKWDAPSAHLDSTAFGLNLDTSSVFLVFLGYSDIGLSLGFKKMKFVNVNPKSYEFVYANLNGSDLKRVKVDKDPNYSKIQFSFTLNEVVFYEPIQSSYDLLFTQYTHTFYNPFQSYLVTGVLINQHGIRVGLIKHKSFLDVNLNDTANLQFTERADAIGYDWKQFSLNDNKFTVDPSKIYIISDKDGFYYKLHFIDFYNEHGQKGFPKFAFQKL
jgi:hypothetical protein